VDTGAVACPSIADALFLDFSENDGSQANFGIPGETFAGGSFVYPSSLTEDFSDDSWHVTGTVDDWAGLGIYIQDDCSPIDASAYRGFTVTISGTLPAGRGLTMWLGTETNTVATSWLVEHDAADVQLTSGICIPTTDNQYDGTCENGSADVPVSETPETVELLWSDFTGGKPESTMNPAQITRFGFRFAWGGDSDTAYDVDVTLDDLGFLE
jgi:hypothetical protein